MFRFCNIQDSTIPQASDLARRWPSCYFVQPRWRMDWNHLARTNHDAAEFRVL